MLSGSEWHAFLDRTAAMDRFGEGGAGMVMDRLSYAGGTDRAVVTNAEFQRLFEAAREWLKNHRSEEAAA